MSNRYSKNYIYGLIMTLFMIFCPVMAFAQTTQFTYQGLLNDGGSPATGTYDLQFRLFDALVGGVQAGSTLIREDVTVSNGLFKVALDFGAPAFPGANRWLEISLRPGASSGAFTLLSPLQPLTSAPYAIKSLSATSADGLSVACVNCVTSGQINNVLGSQVSGTIPVASVPAGSNSYIQNMAGLQAGANFNIGGNGTAGGTLSGNAVNAMAQFNLGGSRVLSNPGTSNLFAGINAGAVNTAGLSNAFFGANAGQQNTTGSFNSFFGKDAGGANVTGSRNTLIGWQAGIANTSDDDNTFLGYKADGAGGINNASALGTRAQVSQSNSLVLGSINGINGATADTRVGIGTTAPTERLAIVGNLKISGQSVTGAPNGIFFNDGSFLNSALNLGTVTSVTADSPLNSSGGPAPNISLTGLVPVVNGGTNLSASGPTGSYLRSNGVNWTSVPLQVLDLPGGNGNYIQNTTSPQASANFNVSGNGTVGGTFSANTLDATAQYNLNTLRILANPGFQNLFTGIGAGGSNTSGSDNAFFGYGAGLNNTSGKDNAYFGTGAGSINVSGNYNSFFGSGAGAGNAGSNNSYFGFSAGNPFSSGSDNSFFGLGAGFNIGGGSRNSFFGISAGASVTTGSDNVLVGRNANGTYPFTGNHNTLLGTDTSLSTAALSYATAIGAEASVATSNTIALGRSAGQDTVNVPGKLIVGTLSAATATHLCINGAGELSDCSSSLRYKQNVAPLAVGLNLLQRLRPVTFNWKESNLPDLGLIAEEVAAVEPLLVTRNHAGEIQGVKYDQLSVVLINALKQQQEQLKQQQAEIEQLKQLVCAMKPQAKVCQPR